MDSDNVPDDIWFTIADLTDGPAQLTALVRTCHRFRRLGSRLLLRELRWVEIDSTAHDIKAWKEKKKDMLCVPRKLTLGVAFDFGAQAAWASQTPQTELHDAIYSQIREFKSLHKITLHRTVVSHYTHNILRLIPTLRVLTIIDCSFIDLRTSFAQYNQNSTPDNSQTPTLSITHLSLSNLVLPNPDLNANQMKYNHFLRLNNLSTLYSLSLSWTKEVNLAFLKFLGFLEGKESWLLPNLAHLDIVIPFLDRFNYLGSLDGFVLGHCPKRPRIRLSIEKHNHSEEGIRGRRVEMSGLWSYNGPLHLLLPFQILTDLTRLAITDAMDLTSIVNNIKKFPKTLHSLDIKVEDREDNVSFAIYIRNLFPTFHSLIVRYGDDGGFVSLGSESAEIEIRKWDVEVLFTIRYCFPTIRFLTIRYGFAIGFDNIFIVRLGCEILFNLPHLHTLKLLQDTSCLKVLSPMPGAHDLQHSLSRSNFSDEYRKSDPPPSLVFADDDLKDYLNAWNRYCMQLRHFQVNKDSWWVRRFEGDQWVKTVFS